MAETPVTNEYGMSDADYARERKAARAAVRSGEAPVETKTTEAEPQPSTETADTTTATQETVVDDTKQDTKATAEVVEEAVPDFLKDIPDDIREKVASQLKAAKDESEYHKKRYDSDIGRINAYQSKYEESRRALAQKEAELAALKKAPPKPLKELEDPRIKQALEAGDESSVELMEALRESLRKEFESALKARDQIRERQDMEVQSRQQLEAADAFNRTLSDRWDNWREVVFKADDKGALVLGEDKQPQFNEGWLQYAYDQPPALRNAILSAESPEDAIWAIDNYEKWLRDKGIVKENTPQAVIPNADAIQKKRDADLQRKSPPAGHQVALAPNPTVDIDSDEGLQKRARQLARKAIKENDPSIYSIQNLTR